MTGPDIPCRAHPWRRRILFLALGFPVLSLLGVALILLFLNWRGLPSPLVHRIEQQLRQFGIHAEIRGIHLQGFRQFVLDKAALSSLSLTNAPLFELQKATLALGLRSSSRPGHSAQLAGAALSWPGANPSGATFLDASQASIALLRSGRLEVHLPDAQMNGASLDLVLRIDHFSRAPKRPPKKPVVSLDQKLAVLRRSLEKLTFAPGSRIRIDILADALDPSAFDATWSITAPQVSVFDWTLSHVELDGSALPSSTPGASQWTLRMKADAAATNRLLRACDLLWTGEFDPDANAFTRVTAELGIAEMAAPDGSGRDLHLRAGSRLEGHRYSTTLEVGGADFQGAGASSSALEASVEIEHLFSAPILFNLNGTFASSDLSLPWGSAGELQLRLSAAAGSSALSGDLADWGLWSRFSRLDADWNLHADGIQSTNTELDTLSLSGTWRAPELSIDHFQAGLYDGHLLGSARLDVATRRLESSAEVTFNAHKIEHLLTPSTRRWLRQFDWSDPPFVKGSAGLTLPSWTNSTPNWRQEVLPSVTLDGWFEGTNGAFRGVPISRGYSHFSLTNHFWRLPDLTVERPEGVSFCDYQWDMESEEYSWDLTAQANPSALRPMLLPTHRKILDDFSFSNSVSASGRIWGRWHHPKETCFTANITATNAAFRGQSTELARARLDLTNQFLIARDVFIRRSDGTVTADGAGFDFKERELFLTNAVSATDPLVIAAVIGTNTLRVLSAYKFRNPPTIHAQGRFPGRPGGPANAHLHISGGPFEYWRFHADHIAADLHWQDRRLDISNFAGHAYGGSLAWQGRFDFDAPKGAGLQVRAKLTDISIQPLVLGLTGKTNKIEGKISGQGIVTDGNSSDPATWRAYATVNLSQGILWEIPLFGFFSPVLNQIVPGLGHTRITGASAAFLLADGHVQTDDLELRSPLFRLNYAGSTDLSGNLDARMEAHLLRDAWVFGKLLSFVFRPFTKAFEFEITGTLKEPVSNPLFIPRLFLVPLQPIRSLRALFPPDKFSAHPEHPKRPAHADPGSRFGPLHRTKGP